MVVPARRRFPRFQPGAHPTLCGNTTHQPNGSNNITALDAANRLTEVRQAETALASFVYAADGSRVKGTVGGVTTVYIAGVYERSGTGSTSYYEGGVMRRSGYAENNGVFYLLQDQLKSTSVIVGQGGVEAARQFFYPYGGNRGGTALSDLTTKRFTGQYHEQGLPGAEGLSFYNARWYDPQLGRFASADTIVPNPNNPQHLNRFAYGGNNPANNTDPTGHYDVKPGDDPWWKNLRSALTKLSQVLPRIYYLNGLGGRKNLIPNESAGFEYDHTLYCLQKYAGSQNVVHVAVFTDAYVRYWSQLQMVQEAVGPVKPWTNKAVETISNDLKSHPLLPGQRIVLVGSSAGGTVAIEALKPLASKGIYVDQVILRGSFEIQFTLTNTNRVDYITADPAYLDEYYSPDVNPFDGINVIEHPVSGLHGHMPDSGDEKRVWTQVGSMIVNLIDEAQSN